MSTRTLWLDDLVEGFLWGIGGAFGLALVAYAGYVAGEASMTTVAERALDGQEYYRDQALEARQKYEDVLAGRLNLSSDQLRACVVEARESGQ